jgi:cold shock CspA family protein
MLIKKVGVLNCWFAERGFGFVIGEEQVGEEKIYTKYFLHISQIKQGIPAMGLPVVFLATEGRKGPIALTAVIEDGKAVQS